MKLEALALIMVAATAFSYGQTYGETTVNIEEKPVFGDTKINYTGVVKAQGRTFNFTDVDGTAIGKSWPRAGAFHPKRNVVRIQTGLEADRTFKVCNHEMLHHELPNYRHKNHARNEDAIYRLDDKTEYDVCYFVVQRALEKSF